MRAISYRTKARMKKSLKIFLAMAAILLLALILFAVYLERFVVYTQEGAHFDFERNT